VACHYRPAPTHRYDRASEYTKPRLDVFNPLRVTTITFANLATNVANRRVPDLQQKIKEETKRELKDWLEFGSNGDPSRG
jgi:hypothetical protein